MGHFSINRLDKTNYSYSDCLNLIKEAFSEHLDEGLHYPCLDYTLESYIENMKDHLIWVVTSEEPVELAGVCSMIILSDGKYKYALEHHAAVSPKYKRHGIGSMMKEEKSKYAKDTCEYMISTTAEKAKNIIKWHKKNGYRIIRYASYSDTNYYSVVMRKQLGDNVKKYNSPLYCALSSYISFIKVKMFKKADGTYRRLGSLILLLINKINH